MSDRYEDLNLYYAEFGSLTDPGHAIGLYSHIPSDIEALVSMIQGLVIHVFWADRYGEPLTEERKNQAGLRHVEQMLNQIMLQDDAPMVESRSLNTQIVGNCRSYSVLLASMLQSKGVPARARCGFGRYFKPDWHEDHWICEYWNAEQSRWVMVDAQLDAFQIQELKIDFDPLDVPRDQFIVGGKAWEACRSGRADPHKHGIFEMRGLWFVRGNLIRDVAALNKIELLPWDSWGWMLKDDSSFRDEELEILDEIAACTFDEVNYLAVRDSYETQDGLRVPSIITSFTPSGALEVDWMLENVV